MKDAIVATQTDAALAEALRAFVENAAQAKNFALEQAPDVIQQLILLETMSSTACIGIGLGCVGYLFWMVPIIRAEAKKSYADRSDFVVGAGTISSVIAGIASVPFLFDGGFDLMRVLFAPKVYLLEYAAHLVRQ